MPAVLPPPEEAKDVKTAIGAARAKMARGGARPGDLDIAAALAARRRVARRVAGVHFRLAQPAAAHFVCRSRPSGPLW